jgi:methyl-accepting chemotaxis protein
VTKGATGDSIKLSAVAGAEVQESLNAGWDRWQPIADKLREALRSESPEIALKENGALELLLANNVPLLKEMNAATVGIQHQGDARQATLEFIQFAGIGLSLLLSGTLAFFLNRSVIRPIDIVRDLMANVAEGDGNLTQEMPVKGNDEISMMASSYNVFLGKIRSIVTAVNGVSEQVASASRELATTSSQTSSALTEQDMKTQELAGAVTEVANASDRVNSITETMRQLVAETEESTTKGSQIASDSQRGMEQLEHQIRQSEEAITRLSDQSDQIGAITNVITDIAEQTNLLALNAAIEAARAGEHGRGFAVVADEVRKLADRTTVATSEITDSVKGIQAETESVLVEIRKSSSVTRKSLEAVSDTVTRLRSIRQSAEQLRDSSEDVANAVSEQTECCNSLNLSISDIATSITQLSEAANLTGEGVGMLADKSEQLEQMMVRFNVHAPDRRLDEEPGSSEHDSVRINPVKSAEAARKFVTSLRKR